MAPAHEVVVVAVVAYVVTALEAQRLHKKMAALAADEIGWDEIALDKLHVLLRHARVLDERRLRRLHGARRAAQAKRSRPL